MAHTPRRVRARNPLKIALLVIVALAVLAGGGFAWFWWQQQQQDATAAAAQAATSAALQATGQAATAVAMAQHSATTATAQATEADLDRNYNAAVAFQNAGNYEQARASFQELIARQPDYKDSAARLKQVNETLAESYYQQGSAAANQQLWAEAVAAFDKVLAIAPNYKDTVAQRAAAARELGATATPTPAPTQAATPTEAAATAVIGTTTLTATAAPTATAALSATSPLTVTTLGVITSGPQLWGAPGQNAQSIPVVESDHPYKNDEDKSWTIDNNSGKSAARIHFSRIELEHGVDLIEIRDAEDRLIQEISASAPDGLWSDPVPGAVIKVVLKSESSGTFWGFAIDQFEPVDVTTLAYSPHPYPNESTESKVLVNDTPEPAGTRVHFDYIDLEDGVDYLVIQDIDDKPYQWITGTHPSGFTSKAVPGSSIKVQLVSDGSGRAWGYNVDRVETAPAEEPDLPPLRDKALAESDHPYPNDVSKVWTLTNPDVNAASSKIHFSRVALAHGEILQVLDANDTVIQTLWNKEQLADFWSDYVPGRVVKVKLTTRHGYEDWGFRVDAIVNSVAHPGLAQSDHPYPNDVSKVWTLTNSDVNAASSKIHFSRIALSRGEILQILDADDTVIQTLRNNEQLIDVWSDYVPGRVVKVKLTTRHGYEDWGFRVDAIVNSIAKPGLAQSDHPYTDNLTKVWTITNPDVDAAASRVHFERIALARGDVLQILDANDAMIQTFERNEQLTDVWSDIVRGRIVKIKLSTRSGYEDWGFRADDIETVNQGP